MQRVLADLRGLPLANGIARGQVPVGVREEADARNIKEDGLVGEVDDAVRQQAFLVLLDLVREAGVAARVPDEKLFFFPETTIY